jgi:two-component system sensor histidine kinase KdpD
MPPRPGEPDRPADDRRGAADGARPKDSSRARGSLKIFFSYAPGAGKTLAMLEDAYRRKQEGTDVVVGFVDVHGELLALQLLEKFEILPHFIITGSGMSYHGMDLDALLARRPQLAIVDHLARPNPPGLRHVMRYLEVEELLDAGIDVYTTLNVYQLESQVDAVSHLTGFIPRETVPDRFLDQADQLELVDFPPQTLVDRYRSGAVYLPKRVETRLQRLFLPSNLFAMRELALRYMARRSNALMRSYLPARRSSADESTAERILVCVSADPNDSRLVRAGRRMSDESGAAWTVVHVETPDGPDQSAGREQVVAQHMRLAEQLGADTETLSGRSVAEVVRDYAHRRHIRRIIIGRSTRRRWLQGLGISMAERLQREDPTLNILVVGSDPTPQPFQVAPLSKWMSWRQLLASLGLVALPTAAGLLLNPTVLSRSANVIMLYLIAVVVASVTLGLAPALLTTILSVLVYDFFFIPPYFRLFWFSPENTVTLASLVVVSIIVNTLVSSQRTVARAAQRRAEHVTHLYELSRDLAAAVDMSDVLETIVQHFRQTFDREVVILLPRWEKLALTASSEKKDLDSSELTAAEWAFQQGRPAGHNTGTFSYASYRYFPLETSRGIIGVIGIGQAGQKPELHPEGVRLLGIFVTKAASAVERALFAEEASQAEILRATEKLQTALLNSISHDLRTPLASITGVLSSLRLDDGLLDPETRRELVETAFGEAERLNRLVGNLLDLTRLESGMLKISRQPCDIQDVIGSTLNALGSRLEGRPVQVSVPPDLPLVGLDYVLIQQVLVNLLDNAAKYAPENSPVAVQVSSAGESLRVEVEDSGPGIPEEDLARIFEKFYRVKRFENVVGTGLGLSICKGIVEVHGGKIWAENRREGGVRIIFTLPLHGALPADQEPAEQVLPEEVQT